MKSYLLKLGRIDWPSAFPSSWSFTDFARAETNALIELTCFSADERFLASEQDPVLLRQRFWISWHSADTAFAEEERELTVQVPGGNRIYLASHLRTKSGPVNRYGDPQHAGFHTLPGRSD